VMYDMTSLVRDLTALIGLALLYVKISKIEKREISPQPLRVMPEFPAVTREECAARHSMVDCRIRKLEEDAQSDRAMFTRAVGELRKDIGMVHRRVDDLLKMVAEMMKGAPR
jgi:hypothetical protein